MYHRMQGRLSVEILKPQGLGPSERAAWAAFRAARPELDSPYFDLRYIEAAGAEAPHARVAVIHRAGQVVGFFPFQRRGGLIQPLGAPLTDYHGAIAAPGERIDIPDLMAALGAGAFRFGGLTMAPDVGAAPPEGLVTHNRLVADLSGGFEAWLAERQAQHGKFYREKARTARAIERDLGPMRLEWLRQDHGVLDYVLALKRAQYRRTRRHDVFACGWTERLLRRLAEAPEPDFGLGFATLYAGDTLLGAEVGLLGGPVYHLWLPAYEARHARYGPGMLTTLETLKLAPDAGVSRVDFGRDDAAYKAYFAEPAGPVFEGLVRSRPPSLDLPALGGRLAGLRERIGRRIDVISACETTALGWCAGALLALGVVASALVPIANTPLARRANVHRPGPHMVARSEGGVREAAAGILSSAG